MDDFIPGQRWISHAELQLGLGTIVAVEFRTIDIVFLATGETRTYAKQSAPLARVRFNEGDVIISHEGFGMTVDSIEQDQGLLTYIGSRDDGSQARIEEGQLDNFMQLNRPGDRLFSNQIDADKWFELRYQARCHQSQLQSSPLRGLCAGRTSLIPHQMYIAHEVARRFAPRVLLADEVGLGKTIEAGMILHQQILTEHARRILIIVPETLLHQWLVEMLRRFNLYFSVFDKQRCLAAIESTDQENPFHTEQLVICSLEFLLANPERAQQAVAGEWDLLVVDEAHHLQWTPNHSSPEYELVEKLAAITRGVLLLTATPEQLGKQSHFARLRLLDPDRFTDYQAFIDEEQGYGHIADAVEKLLHKKELDAGVIKTITTTISEGDNQQSLQILTDPDSNESDQQVARTKLIDHLLDRHGTGRILFRNTRSAIKGFPSRHLNACPLPLPDQYAQDQQQIQDTAVNDLKVLLSPELVYQSIHDDNPDAWQDFDPRLNWLIDSINVLGKEKILIICASAFTAIDLADYLRVQAGIHAAVFHQGLSIVERDRAAAFFADMEFGSQILICSEIGSEGRNFQFSHNLILFDLPLNPDLLEQRIGRLDRIGQQHTIQIHVPYLLGSAQEIMFEWYHHGLNAFSATCPAGHTVFTKMRDALSEALHQINSGIEDLPALIATSAQQVQELNLELQSGRDPLLEYNSCRPHIASSIIDQAQAEDTPQVLLGFIENVFDCYGVDFEDHSNDIYIAKPTDHMQPVNFPGLNEDGMTLTCNREIALTNEDIHFITWEHPLVTTSIDLVCGNELGNCSVTAIKSPKLKAGMLLMENFYVLEPQVKDSASSSRVLPTVVIRTLMDQKGNDHSKDLSHEDIAAQRMDIAAETAVKITQGFADMLREMLPRSEIQANSTAPVILKQAYQQTRQTLITEVERLQALQRINANVRADEIEFFQTQLSDLEQAVDSSILQLDAIRVIVTI